MNSIETALLANDLTPCVAPPLPATCLCRTSPTRHDAAPRRRRELEARATYEAGADPAAFALSPAFSAAVSTALAASDTALLAPDKSPEKALLIS